MNNCNDYPWAPEKFIQGTLFRRFQSVAADRFRVFTKVLAGGWKRLRASERKNPPRRQTKSEPRRNYRTRQKKTQLANLLIAPLRTLFGPALSLANCYLWL